MRLALLATLVLGAAAVFGTHWATASSLAISADSLTVFTAPGTVPVTTCTVTASADTYVDETFTLSNFGSETAFYVRSLDIEDRRALVRFDLSTCSIPSDASVQSSRLRLYASNAPDEDRTYDAYRITESWTEGGVTWSSQPSIAGTVTDTIFTGTSDGIWMEWTVTTDVAGFVDGSLANLGWLVRDRTEDTLLLGQMTEFISRESTETARHPMLTVEYYP